MIRENLIAERLLGAKDILKIIRFIGLILLIKVLIIGIIFVLCPFLIGHYIWNWADERIERIDNAEDVCCRKSD
jgi:hypothetical protein